ASVVVERLPEGVLTAVRSLLDEVSPAVRRLLVGGRRIGHSFTVEQAADLLGESAPGLSSGVDEAVQVGLMRRDGMELTFTHQVVGEALQHAAFRGWEPAAAVAPAVPETRHPATSVADARTERATAPPPQSQSAGCGCEDMAARAIADLERTFDEAPRALARALRLLAGAGRGVERCRPVDGALPPRIAPACPAVL